MRQAVKLGSKCTGWYWVDGSPGYWEHVNGKVIGVSRKVFDVGVGSGYLQCKVQIKTSEGTKIGYIIQSSKKCLNELGSMTFLNASVGRLPKFRNGRIIGGCSTKVFLV